MTELIAIHNFKGDQPGDLAFAKGDHLIGINLNGEWWHGKDRFDKEGSFPSNYVKEVSAAEIPGPPSTGAAFQPPPPGPIRRQSGSGPVDNNYGNLPSGPPAPSTASPPASSKEESSEEKTRMGLVAVIRGLQVITSLFALSFMGATTGGLQYTYNKDEAGKNLSPSIKADLPTNDGVKLVLAMSILGWLESSFFFILACLVLKNMCNLRQKIQAMVNFSLITFCIDCFLAWLTLIAVTVCPTETLIQDGRAKAAAIFLMFYLMILMYSILMSYKDMTKLKLIRQGWTPPPGYIAPGQIAATLDP
jgi:hypothetical protein